MKTWFEKELQTYETHKAELLKKTPGKYVLIKDDQIIDVFDTQMDAVNQGYRRFGVVPFLVKEIVEIEMPLDFTLNFFLGV